MLIMGLLKSKQKKILLFRTLWLTLLLISVTILISACQPGFLTADTLPWVSKDPVLFVDNFTEKTGGWKTHEDRISFAGYTNGGFRLWVDLPDFLIWSVPKLNFQNVNVHTKVAKISGPNNNLYGLLCRYQDGDNYYAFLISTDGYYGIFIKEAGIMRLIDLNQMGYSDIIQGNAGENKISAACHDNKLALLVNDTKLLQVEDNTFTHGDVGVIAGSLSEPGAEVLFKYFIVMKP